MGKLIGALFGFLLGKGIDDGVFVTFALAVAGFVAGVVVDRQRAAQSGAPGSDLAARLAALERRRASGEGSVVDLSMTEAISTLLGGQVVRAAMEGRLPPRPGDRDRDRSRRRRV